MKSKVIVLVFLTVLIAAPLMAQDWDSAKPQIFSFGFGVPVGYDLSMEKAAAGANFALGISVTDHFDIGFENMMNVSLLRVSFSFSDIFGASIGYGSGNTVILGVFGNFVQVRAKNGIAYGFGTKIDYMADVTGDIAKGRILFTPRMTFGL